MYDVADIPGTRLPCGFATPPTIRPRESRRTIRRVIGPPSARPGWVSRSETVRSSGAVRAGGANLHARLCDLVAGFGLDLDLPCAPEAPDAHVASLVGTLLSQTAHGEPADVVVRDLAALRRKLAS